MNLLIKKINISVATIILMAFSSSVVVFHLLILFGTLPYDMVWGGRLEEKFQLYIFETVSIIINLLIILVVGIKGGYIKPYMPQRAVNFILWVLVVLFALNTLGNLLSNNRMEMILFTPLTMIGTILFYRMAIE